MSPTPRVIDSLHGLPMRYEQAIEAFEQQWLEGSRPPIERFLPDDAARLAVLAELIIAELEFRLKQGEDARLEEYLPRFPDLAEDRAALIRIAREEFRIRRKRHEPLSSMAFASRFEQLRPDLERVLRTDPLNTFPPGPPRVEGNAADGKAEVGAALTDMEWLANGGMGEVWIARDATLQRRVAMKVIQRKFERNAEALRRFMSEAEVTSRLEHPGVAPIYGLGESADGRPCYAMRFIRGESMGDAVRRFFCREETSPAATPADSGSADGGAGGRDHPRTRLDLHRAGRKLVFRELLQRFIAACHTTAYAHSQGVLHRDLKPDNLRLGEHGETILLDWGLAKRLDQEGDENGAAPAAPEAPRDDGKTKVGAIYGTPQFMSPEQARRDGPPLTPASDIYGLGATLYFLLTGRAPFPREAPARIVARVIAGDFPPPRAICRDVPPPLEAICLKAMALSPDDRYATASELAKDLERYLADEPVSVYADPPSARARRWVARHRLFAAVGATAAIALGVVLAAVSLLSNQYARDLARKNAELQGAKQVVDDALGLQTALALELRSKNLELEKASAAAQSAALDAQKQRDAANARSDQVLGLTSSLVEMVTVSGPEWFRYDPHAIDRSKIRQFSPGEYLDNVVAKVNQKFAPDDLARAEVLAAVGQTKRSIGLFESAEPVLAEALRVRRMHAGEDDIIAAGIEFNLAWCLVEIQGRAEEACDRFRNVIRIRRLQQPRDQAALGMAQAGLLMALFVLEKSEPEYLLELGPEFEVEGVWNSINIAKLLITLEKADKARSTRNWRDGDLLFQKASDDIDKLVPEGHPFRAARDFAMAGYLRDRGDPRAGQPFIERGMKVYRERVGIHTYMCDPLYHLARFYEDFGDEAEAESLHREAYWLAGLNPNTMRSFRNLTTQGLCGFLLRTGKHDELRELIARELADPSRTRGVDVDQLVARRIESYLEAGDYEEVIAELSAPRKENPHLKDAPTQLCRALFEAGRFVDANAIMPIATQLSRDEYLPRPPFQFDELLRKAGRGDARTPEEVESLIPQEESERRRAATVDLLMQLARRNMASRRIEVAEANLAEAAAIAEQRRPTVDRVFIDLIIDHALLRLDADDAAGAITELERALAAVNARYPKESLISSEFLHQAGLISQAAGDLSRAQRYLDAAIAIRRRRWTEVNHRVWFPVLDRVEATPDPRERRAFLRTQIRLMSQRGVSHWRIAVLTRELGAAERQLGELNGAERSLLDAWSVFQPMLGEAHELSRVTAEELARVFAGQGRDAEADRWRALSEAAP